MAHLLQELCKTPDFKPYELSLEFLDLYPPTINKKLSLSQKVLTSCQPNP